MFGTRSAKTLSLNPTHDLRVFTEQVNKQLNEVLKRLVSLERRLKKMPTRDELNAVKAELKQAIIDEATQVAADIQALRDALAAGNPITDEDLADLKAAVQGVAGIDPS
jgi:hypothetical protein